jgi:uncharacterized protein YkwD
MSMVTAPAEAKPCGDARARAAQASVSALGEAVTCLLNQERRKAGLRRLLPNRRLDAAAIRHARDMRDRDYFSHTSWDGRTFSQRILAAGYMRAQDPWKVGETLAWGAGRSSRPAALVVALLNSATHRAVILDGDYDDLGIGLVRGTPTTETDGVTLVVDFGTLDPPDRSSPPAAEQPAPPSEPSPDPGPGRDQTPDQDQDKDPGRGKDRDDADRGRGNEKDKDEKVKEKDRDKPSHGSE